MFDLYKSSWGVTVQVKNSKRYDGKHFPAYPKCGIEFMSIERVDTIDNEAAAQDLRDEEQQEENEAARRELI